MKGVSCLVMAVTGLLTVDIPVSGDPNPQPQPLPQPQPQPLPFPQPQGISGPDQELLTKYLLRRLLDDARKDDLSFSDTEVTERSDQDSSPSILYPRVPSQSVHKPLRILLDQAKENIDVIDFRAPRRREQQREQYYEDHSRYPRNNDDHIQDERPERASPSESIPTFLPFPGVESIRESRSSRNCIDCGEPSKTATRFAMPLTHLGQKKYYLGIFFKANWFKAQQYCRFHGMHLASITSEAEQKDLEEHIESYGMGHEHFWTSGTDQAEEGKFFWMSSGKPVTYENWNAGEPNNFTYENGEEEHCLELWNRDGKGLRWNDTPCSFETFFICEV